MKGRPVGCACADRTVPFLFSGAAIRRCVAWPNPKAHSGVSLPAAARFVERMGRPMTVDRKTRHRAFVG